MTSGLFKFYDTYDKTDTPIVFYKAGDCFPKEMLPRLKELVKSFSEMRSYYSANQCSALVLYVFMKELEQEFQQFNVGEETPFGKGALGFGFSIESGDNPAEVLSEYIYEIWPTNHGREANVICLDDDEEMEEKDGCMAI